MLKLEVLAVWILERTVFKNKEQNLLIDIYHSNRPGQQEKLVARTVRQLSPKSVQSLE